MPGLVDICQLAESANGSLNGIARGIAAKAVFQADMDLFDEFGDALCIIETGLCCFLKKKRKEFNRIAGKGFTADRQAWPWGKSGVDLRMEVERKSNSTCMRLDIFEIFRIVSRTRPNFWQQHT